jgi:hypothetical protein
MWRGQLLYRSAAEQTARMDALRHPDGRVQVTFEYDEVLVLSDALSRWLDSSADVPPLAHRAESVALNDLLAVFEPLVDEAFAADYNAVLSRARRAVEDEGT